LKSYSDGDLHRYGELLRSSVHISDYKGK